MSAGVASAAYHAARTLSPAGLPLQTREETRLLVLAGCGEETLPPRGESDRLWRKAVRARTPLPPRQGGKVCIVLEGKLNTSHPTRCAPFQHGGPKANQSAAYYPKYRFLFAHSDN